MPALLEAPARGQVVVVDGIGPMEMLSPGFRNATSRAMLRFLDSEAVNMARVTQAAKTVKAHPRVRVCTLTRETREDLPGQILSELALRGLPRARPGRRDRA